ncbi:hypothetical protein BJ138DRAFT_1158500 [Hygrophoropsis aurantiaca]|uniref:Uncharacterized protein n=1 Tax=Hygrophoropsis aurantiaca TaxID=72124 RepID=A0ACB8A5Y4_9AGAM|nr:hypothetical protein BJ138DRAFT_1158500 [Hygrophoropsis aurantiaca]
MKSTYLAWLIIALLFVRLCLLPTRTPSSSLPRSDFKLQVQASSYSSPLLTIYTSPTSPKPWLANESKPRVPLAPRPTRTRTRALTRPLRRSQIPHRGHMRER